MGQHCTALVYEKKNKNLEMPFKNDKFYRETNKLIF